MSSSDRRGPKGNGATKGDERSRSKRGRRSAALSEGRDEGQSVEELRAQLKVAAAERAGLEEQVRQLHRVKTMIDLFSGVAHDLSGAMTGIIWCAEALKRRAADSALALEGGLADFLEAAVYARKLARRLMSIAEHRDAVVSVLPIHEVVKEAVLLVETLRPPRAHLEVRLAAAACSVRGVSEQLQQVVINLITNAFDAVSQGGNVLLEVAVDPLDSDGPQPWLRLRVADDGVGMPPDVQARAFEPFFTTKSPTGGNGLGLVVVRNIVQSHAGYVELTSEPGGGTTVDVFLPKHRGSTVS